MNIVECHQILELILGGVWTLGTTTNMSNSQRFNFTLANIQSETVEITDWRSLGYQLHVPKHQLDAIEEDFRRVKRCKEEVLSYWLRNDVHASWELLVTAIRRLRTHNVLAYRLQRKYVQNGTHFSAEVEWETAESDRTCTQLIQRGLRRIFSSVLPYCTTGISKMQKHPMLSLKVALLLFVVLSVLCASEGEKATRGDVCHPTYVGMSLFITLTFVSSFISLEWHVFRSKDDVVKVGLRLFFFFCAIVLLFSILGNALQLEILPPTNPLCLLFKYAVGGVSGLFQSVFSLLVLIIETELYWAMFYILRYYYRQEWWWEHCMSVFYVVSCVSIAVLVHSVEWHVFSAFTASIVLFVSFGALANLWFYHLVRFDFLWNVHSCFVAYMFWIISCKPA